MGKKDKGGFKSLIEHIKQEIISSTGKPVEIREETHLDKILSEEVEDINLTVEEAEKKLKKAKAKLNDDPSVKDAREKFKVAKANLDEAEQAYKKAEESGQGVEVALADKNNSAAEFEKAESIKIKTEKQVRDELKLTKLESDLKEAKTEREDTEKGLLWPPYYHYKDKLWSYFWFVKNPKNLSEVLKEKGKEIDHYEKDCLVLIEKKGNDSPSGDNKVYFDKYPIIQTLWRFIKRLVRFIIWLFYVFVGSIFSGFKGNFKSFWLCLGILSIDIAGFWVFYQLLKLLLAGGKFVIGLIANIVIEFVKPCVDLLIEHLPIEHLNLFGGVKLIISIIIGVILITLIIFFIKGFWRKVSNTCVCRKIGESFKKRWHKVGQIAICIKVGAFVKRFFKDNWWQKVGTYIDKNDLDASRWRKPNAVVLFLCFILFVYFVISTVLFFVRDVVFFQPKMSITESGVVKMTQSCGVEQYLFVHSSAELWKNTGISVVKDDEIEVNYSGAFYSTIRDMDKSAVLRTPPRYRLMNSRQYGDGYGDDSIVRYCVYNDEEKARIGQLLLQITPPGQKPKSWVGDSLIYAVDFSDGKYQNLFSAKKSGTLMVAVNDVYLKKERIKGMLDSIDNEHLRCELLNHALYPMTSELLSSQSEKLTSEITDSVTSRFLYPPKKLVFFEMIRYSLLGQAIQDRNKKIKKELDKLFIKNEEIQHTHNLIRALVTCGDSIKINSDTTIYSLLIDELQNDNLFTAKNKYNHPIKRTFAKHGADSTLVNSLFEINEKIQHTHNLIRALVNSNDSDSVRNEYEKVITNIKNEDKDKKLTAKNIYNYIDSLWHSSFNIIKTHYETVRFVEKMSDGTNINIDSITPLICDISRNNQKSQKNITIVDSIIKKKGFNNLVLKDGCVVYVNNQDTEIKRDKDNLYAILFKYYITQRDEILKQLYKFLKSSDQLNWEEDAQDFWYSDNVGDLLVGVRVSRNDIPWHMKIVRFIDRKIDRLGKDAQDIWYIFVVCVFILLLFLDCYFGAKKNMRLIKENLKKTEKCNNNNVNRFLTETSEKILPYYEERLSNDKFLVLLKIIAALIILWIISLLMGPDYVVVTGMIVLLGIIICNWEVLFCKNYKNVIQKDIDFLKKLKK